MTLWKAGMLTLLLSMTVGCASVFGQSATEYFEDDAQRALAEAAAAGDSNPKFPDIDKVHAVEQFSSLMFQANLERTGVYDDIGPEESPELVWKFDTGAAVLATPLVYEGIVYFVDFEGGVYAVSQDDGSVIWEKDLGGQPSFHITLNDDVLLVGRRFSRDDNESYLAAFDRLTGEEKWRFSPDDLSGMDYPIIHEDMVFLTSMSDHLFALDLSTGEEVWRFPINGGGRYPLISGGNLYYQDESQSIYSLSLDDGAVLSSYSSLHDYRNYMSTPAVDDCCIYAVELYGESGSLVKIDKSNLERLDNFPIRFRSDSSVSLADGVAFFGDDGEGDTGDHGYMNAMDIKSGKLIWTFETGGFVRGSAAIAGDTVYFGSIDENLYAVDRHTGEMRWRYKTNGVVTSSPAIVDGRVYFGSVDGHVYVLE